MAGGGGDGDGRGGEGVDVVGVVGGDGGGGGGGGGGGDGEGSGSVGGVGGVGGSGGFPRRVGVATATAAAARASTSSSSAAAVELAAASRRRRRRRRRAGGEGTQREAESPPQEGRPPSRGPDTRNRTSNPDSWVLPGRTTIGGSVLSARRSGCEAGTAHRARTSNSTSLPGRDRGEVVDLGPRSGGAGGSPAPFLLRHRGKRHDLVGTSLGLKRREGVGAAATRGVELCVRCV